MSGIIINPYSFAATGLSPAAFVTEWTVGAGDTIKLYSWDGIHYGFTLDYDVDWGDGSSDSNVTTDDKTHTYADAGTYQVVITNQFGALNMLRANATERSYFTNMVQWGTDNIWSSLARMFYQCTVMQYTATDYPNITNLVENTQFREVFYNCDAVDNLDLTNWTNTANFTYLYFAFGQMGALETLNLTGWDTSNVTYNYNMCSNSGDTVDGCVFTMPDLDWTSISPSSIFYGAKCRGNLDVSGWKFGASSTVSQVFRNSDRGSAGTPFTIDASGWLQTSNIISLSGCFRDTDADSINLTGIDTQNVTDMNYIFYYNINLTHITGLDTFDATSLTTASIMFQYTRKYDWSTASANFGANWGPNLGNVTNMSNMFYQTGYTTPGSAPPNVSNWDTSGVTTMENMFRQAKWGGGSIDVSSWDVSNVTGFGMRFMFREAVGLTAGLDTSGWQISSNVTDMSNWAYYSDLGGDIDLSHASCDLSGITTWAAAFQGTALTGFKLHASSSFAAITSMTNMFYVGTVLIPTADYDALLLRCAATNTNTNVTLTATASNYTLGGAVETARDTTLIAGLSWTINDSGGI